MLVFLSYEGFELIANASDRIRQPRGRCPSPTYGSVGVAIVLYVLLVVVTLGHLPFGRDRPHAELCAGGRRPDVHRRASASRCSAIGAVLAAASAINADLFGASKLPVILAQTGEAPRWYGREVWERYPAALALVAVLAVLITQTGDLRRSRRRRAPDSSWCSRWSISPMPSSPRRPAACAGSSGVAALLPASRPSRPCWRRWRQSAAARGQLRLVVGLLALPFAYQLVLRWRLRPRPTRATPGHRRCVAPWARWLCWWAST